MAKNRLIYEEFFQEQIKIYSRRQNIEREGGIKFNISSAILAQSKKLFPYTLTSGQEQVVDEMAHELGQGEVMMKLLQGDVGCGKTSVALVAIYLAYRSGYQSTLMCPTESLALQHFSTVKKIFSPQKLAVEILIGSTTPKEKNRIKEELLQGKIDLLLGTHALIQDSVSLLSFRSNHY